MTTPEIPQEAAVPDPQVVPPVAQVEDGTGEIRAAAEDASPNAEAANYRRKLRAIEAETETLRAKIDSMHRAEITRIVGDTAELAVPESFWSSGIQLSDLQNEDGDIDIAKVKAAAIDVRESMGLAVRSRLPAPDFSQGQRGLPMGKPDESPWNKFLKP